MHTTTNAHPRRPRLLSLGLALLTTSACFEKPDPPDLGQDGSSSGGDTESPESSTSGEPGDGSTTSTDPADGTDESGDPPPGDEVCNGLDDDGDGVVDEDQPMLSCGVGACEVSVPSCVEGGLQECTPALPGGEVCNGLDDDCNGSFDEGLEGCRVVIYRAVSPAPQHVYANSIEEAQCCGNWYEGPTFQLYADMHAGLVPFYRCEGAGGYQLLSLDAACEGLSNAGVLGYLATVEGTAGAVHLFRLSHANGDHLYLTSEAERDQAVAMYGYVDEGTIGHVWSLE